MTTGCENAYDCKVAAKEIQKCQKRDDKGLTHQASSRLLILFEMSESKGKFGLQMLAAATQVFFVVGKS